MEFLARVQRSWIGKLFYWMKPIVYLYHLFFVVLGALVYRFPSRKIKIIGITGTKGKTTTVELMASVLAASCEKVAFVSSSSVSTGGVVTKNGTGNSMPGRMFIERFLRRAVDEGCTYAVLEVTSQGVALSRHRLIRFAAAVFTNLAPEHIESHGSYAKYRAAKLRFLAYAATEGAPVFLNEKDKESASFAKALEGRRVILYGKPDASMSALPDALLGSFNEENIAAVLAVARFFAMPEVGIKRGIEGFRGVPGRVEFVARSPFAVVVDYAHTPDSLEAIYHTLRADLASRAGPRPGRLICVLGAAGGGRDKWKRPEMGRIAADNCDEIILTDEDPYDEDPERILDDVADGFKNSSKEKFKDPLSYYEILDRRAALEKALSLAGAGDTVVATGKGSETWIHVKDGKKIPWSERKTFEELLKTRPH